MNEMLTFTELRALAEKHGWKVYVDEDGWAAFSIDSNFAGKFFYIHPTQRKFLNRLTDMLEQFHKDCNELAFKRNYGAFEELVHAAFDFINEKADLIIW